MTTPRVLVSTLLAAVLPQLAAQDVRRTFAVRIDGRVVGHCTETEQRTTEDGRDVVRFHGRTLVKVELLGANIDQHVEQTWVLAADTRAVLRMESVLVAGNTRVAVAGRLTDAGFRLDGSDAVLDPATVVIAPDLRWLRDRGPGRAGHTVETDCLMPELGGVQRLHVRWAAEHERSLEVLGEPTPVRVYELLVPAAGLQSTMFVRSSDHELVRCDLPAQQLVMTQVAPSVVERLERVDLTGTILVRTNLDVEDPSVLTSMRLRAVIETRKDVTAEDLNVPGQRFEGTVQDGRIDGVFTIHSRRVAGEHTPPFPVPADTFAAAALRPYLLPEPDIESDDAGIAGKARELAAGAANCLEVVDRLARWAHDEIPYEIPGGGSARRTFETRRGECGGHSRVLAAMLRSLGIPARTPMGGMYVPLYGGSFAQHMWTEVWLGDAIGWLPVDCTAGQTTFADAGHIRLGDGVAPFGPKSIEVLDHEPKSAAVPFDPATRRTDAWPWQVDEPFVYEWSIGGKAIGDEQVVYRGLHDGAHRFDDRVSLQDGRFVERTRTAVGADGRLVCLQVERSAGGNQETIDVTLADGVATFARKSPEGDRSHTLPVEPSVFGLHNNCTVHFAIALSRIAPLAEGARHRVRFVHSEQRSVFTMSLRVGGTEQIDVGGTRVPARVVHADLVGLPITLHVDDDGRLLRYHQQQGDVRIALQRLHAR